MAIDYEKLDNWESAKSVFAKIIGKTEYQKVNKQLKLFATIDGILEASDKAAAKVIKGQKKNNLIPEDAQKVILDNNKLLSPQAKTLAEALDDTLDDKYDKAIEDLVAELEMYKMVYTSLLKSNMLGKKEDLTRLQLAFSKNEFLKPGSFEKTFARGDEAFQVVARVLREYTANKKDVTKEDTKNLYDTYNKSLPGNSNGVRSITTFLKSFIDYETYFEKYSISNSDFKKLKLHDAIKDYDTFRQYAKGAVLYIGKLTPWATSEGNLLKNDYIDQKTNESADVVIKDIAERLMKGKRAFIEAKTFFIKLF